MFTTYECHAFTINIVQLSVKIKFVGKKNPHIVLHVNCKHHGLLNGWVQNNKQNILTPISLCINSFC